MDSHNLSTNPTTNDNSLAGKPPIATFIAVLLSFAGFQGWLKLLLIGAIFETSRRVAFRALGSSVDSFCITVDFEEGNRSLDWMLLWLSQRPGLEKAGRFAIRDSPPGLKSSLDDFDPKNGRKAHFLLADRHVYTFWHKRRYVKAVRVRSDPSVIRPGMSVSLHVSIFGGGRETVDELLVEAKECWRKAREERISIYGFDLMNIPGGGWRLTASHPKRLLDSIILDNDVKEDILHDARDFLSSKKWYSERGIPFRRGYLLYGAPGSGKTSLIQSVAGELNLDVYIVSLSRTGLNDNSLRELISKLPERCIALMEDIDVAFHETSDRELPEEGRASEEVKVFVGPATQRDRTNKVSLSGLLNALDGVGAQEGRILFATTNRFKDLDAALRRPGRMDYLVEFKLASQYQVGELFKKFYLPNPHTSTSQRSPDRDPTTSKDEDGNRRPSNPGGGTPVEPETEKLIDLESPMGMQDQPFSMIVHRSKRDVGVSPEQLDVLVERFRESIPEREFSMAALQGYLLMHKSQPRRAVECAGKWVEEEMAKRKPN